MDLIYADANRTDLGIIQKYELDNEINIDKDKCTFEVKTTLDDYLFNNACYFYADGTEYGGIVDSRKIDTGKSVMYLSGRTWRGILGSKILEPNAGDDYLVMNGDLNELLRDILIRVHLTDMFDAPDDPYGVVVRYQFNRYTDAYTGIRKMLATKGLKPMFRFENGKVLLYISQIVNFNDEKEITSDLFDFVIDKTERFPNHIIGLGSGDLAERQVVHRYIQEDGTVGTTQFYFDSDEYTITYEYSNAESLDDLIEKTEEELAKQSVESGVKLTSDNLEADIGDVFTATEEITGISVNEQIEGKIFKIGSSKTTISYNVGGIK